MKVKSRHIKKAKRKSVSKTKTASDANSDQLVSKLVKIEGIDDASKFDECNCFVLLPRDDDQEKKKKKNKGKRKSDHEEKPLLSNRQRKRLQKVVDRKARKLDRRVILEKLKSHQLNEDERKDFVPVSDVGVLRKKLKATGRKKKRLEIMEHLNLSLTNDTDSDCTVDNYADKPGVTDANQGTASSEDDCLEEDEVISQTSDTAVSKRSWHVEFGKVHKFTEKTTTPIATSAESLLPIIKKPKRQESHAVIMAFDETELDCSDQLTTIEAWTSGQFTVEEMQQEFPLGIPTDNVVAIAASSTTEKVAEPVSTKKYVLVERSSEMQEFRSKLPVMSEEHHIMDAINHNDVVVICGVTGSGKTTQVPQFMYEYGYCSSSKRIGVTEPRRTAARQVSFKVAEELSLSEREVSFQTRFGGNASKHTLIKFMTDGIMLREIQEDRLLESYSAVIIDEAHERTVYSDILMGILTRVCDKRREANMDPLKLVVMSATLEHENFTANKLLFPKIPPIISIDTRQFPVEIKFSRSTVDNYIDSAFDTVCQIHRLESNGGILVFVTGKLEVNQLCHRLTNRFPKTTTNRQKSTLLRLSIKHQTEPKSLSEYPVLPDTRHTVEDEHTEISVDDDELEALAGPLHVLPLHATLKDHEQRRVFEPLPNGCRLCVVATNVAEVSLTIPGVKYVVDTGKQKIRSYNRATGSSCFQIEWISKASAAQRAGRAGRTCQGSCYRLYSSAVFEDKFCEHPEPEILRKPLEEVIMQLRALEIDANIHKFPYPTPPPAESLKAAENTLVMLNLVALQRDESKAIVTGQLTLMGTLVSSFPVNPRHGKILVAAYYNGVLDYAILLVSVLSINDYLLAGCAQLTEKTTTGSRTIPLNEVRQKLIGKGIAGELGDLIIYMTAQEVFHRNKDPEARRKFCDCYGIRHAAAEDASKLRIQLQNTAARVFSTYSPCEQLGYISDEQVVSLLIAVMCGMVDKIARKSGDTVKIEGKMVKNAYQLISSDSLAWIHSTSSVFEKLPEYLTYQDLMEINGRLYMQGNCAIKACWIPAYLKRHCSFGDPKEITFDHESGKLQCMRLSDFGPHKWMMPAIKTTFPLNRSIYKYFAMHVLLGNVAPKLKEYAGTLLTNPRMINQSFSRLHDRVLMFIGALEMADVWNRDILMKKWKDDSKFLLQEYLRFQSKSAHASIASMWPPALP